MDRTAPRSGGLILLLGAGASIPAGIPDVLRFYREFEREVRRRAKDDPLRIALEEVADAWAASRVSHPLDLERFYEVLSWINGEEPEPSIPLQLAPLFPQRSRATELLFWELKKVVQARCLSFGSLASLEPLAAIARAFSPLTVLSLNYDTCVESLLERARLDWTDGFPRQTPKPCAWSQPSFDSTTTAGGPAVRLLKLHGSASWYQTSPGWMQRAQGRSQHGIGIGFGTARTMTAEAMMVYPTLNKALADGPFPTLLSAAQSALAASSLCLAIGYSFGDVHVRRLVLGALATQPKLRLVIVNPQADAVITSLLKDLDSRSLRDRIGVPSLERDAQGRLLRGFVERALADGWLLDRCHAWLGEEPIECLGQPALSAAARASRPWRLRLAVPGGVTGMARRGTTLAFVAKETKEIRALDLETGGVRVLSREFRRPRGLAWDEVSGALFVVENVYRIGCGRLALTLRKEGIGRLWELRSGAHFARPLTSVRLSALLRSPLLLARAVRGQLRREELWRLLQGALRWPVSVIVEHPGEALLLTEATRLRRLDLATGELTSPLEIPLCTNLGGLALRHGDSLWLTDAGLYPSGSGRWMRGNLATGEVEILAEGWRLLHGIAELRSSGLVLLSLGDPLPGGRVIALDPTRPTGPPLSTWLGLDRPGALCPTADERSVLVATRQGIVELEA